MISPLLSRSAANGTNTFASLGGSTGHTPNSAELEAANPMPAAGTLSNFVVRLDTAPGAAASGKSWTLTVEKNGADTALTCTISETGQTGADLSHSVSYVAGDRISVKATPANTPSTGTVAFSMDNDCVSGQALVSGGDSTLSTSASTYVPLQNGATATASTNLAVPVPTDGTISKLYLSAGGSPGTSKSYTAVLVKNGTDTALTAQISGAATTANDTTHSVSVTAGDTVYWRFDPAGTPTARRIHLGALFTPASGGESIQTTTSTDSLATTGTTFGGVAGGAGAMSSETLRAMWQPSSYILMKLRVVLTTPPGSGKSRAFTIRDASTSTAVTATIADTATTANDLTHTATSTAIDRLAVQEVPTATPATSPLQYGFVTFRVSPLLPAGIASAEAIGSPTLSGASSAISPTGIASAEALGTPTVNPKISPTGIASAQAIGSPTLTTGAVTVSPTGIASAQAIGSAALAIAGSIIPTGIASAQAIGTPKLNLKLTPTGVASAQAFGSPTVHAGTVRILASSITSGAAVGTPGITQPTVILTATGIPSAENVPGPATDNGDGTAAGGGIVRALPVGTVATPRDLFVDTVTGEIYEWPINHLGESVLTLGGQQGSFGGLTDNVGLARQQSQDDPRTLQLQGTVLDIAQRNALQDFFDRCDDRQLIFAHAEGLAWVVIITNYDARHERVFANPHDPSIGFFWRITVDLAVEAF